MAKWMSAIRNVNPIPINRAAGKIFPKEKEVAFWKNRSSTNASHNPTKTSDGNQLSQKNTKKRRPRRRLMTISTSSDGKWKDKWRCDYIFSLQELGLQDLAEEVEGQRDTPVSITLSFQKHASFGLSVDGTIITSFMRNCIICSSPYCSKFHTDFNVWVLPSRKQRHAKEMPEIGGGDPSVIYVKPGEEVDLDSHIKDTIRLAFSFQAACSESCEKAEPRIHYIGVQNPPSTERRWSKLLELRNAY